MRRHGHITVANPDHEQAKKELDSSVGEKHTVQADVLSLAKNKKNLISSFEEEKSRIDEELAEARKTLAVFLEESEQKHRNIQAGISVAESIRDEVDGENKKLEERKQVLGLQIPILETKKEQLTNAVEDLKATQFDFVQKIIDSKKEFETIDSKKIRIESDVKNLEQKKSEKEKEHEILSVKVIEHSDVVDKLSITKQQLETDIITIEKSIVTGKETLKTLQTEEDAIKEKVRVHIEKINKEDVRIKEALGNLARVEHRVQIQLETLKEARKFFSTEQLIRVGIRD